MEFLHRVDRVVEVFEGIVRPEHAHLAVAKRPSRIEVGGDPATVQIDRLVSRGGVNPAAEINLPQAVLVAPAFDQRIDVPVVQDQRLRLDEPVLLATTGVAGLDVVDVQATVDMLRPPADVRPTEDVLVVKARPIRIVAADCELTHVGEAHSLEDVTPSPLPTEFWAVSRHDSVRGWLPLGSVGTPSVQ
jgi:hypothetical protein